MAQDIRSQDSVRAALEQHKVVGVLRAASGAQALEAAEAALEGGLRVLELTFTTPGVTDLIEQLQGRALVGVGTVVTAEQMQAAHEASAAFLVSPHFDEELVKLAGQLDILYIPGVLTPSEVQRARQAGAAMVKLFPIARAGGVTYLKDLLAPFPDLIAMVTGGVTLTDVPAYLEAGAKAVGVGALFGGNAAEVTARTRQVLAELHG